MKVPVKDIAEVQLGYQPREQLDVDPRGTHRLIQMRDISDGTINTDSLGQFTPKREVDRFIVSAGDVLFLARGGTNDSLVVEDVPANTLASNHFFILRPDCTRIHPGYLAWYLNTRPVRSLLAASAQGTTTMLVPKNEFESMDVEVPEMEVQERVAKIAALHRKERHLTLALETRREVLIEALCLRAATNEEHTWER